MRRSSQLLSRLDLTENRGTSSSSNNNVDDDDDDDDNNSQQQSLSEPTISTNSIHNRFLLLSAYPSFEQNNNHNQTDHLLRPHIPRHLLTHEQRQQRKRHKFQRPFLLVDQRRQFANLLQSFFLDKYQQLYEDLSRRLHVDISILDYNYVRLFKCIDIMTNERIRCRFQSQSRETTEQLPLNEYAIALEFYLQFDMNLFFMKTCSFRGARPYRSNLFSLDEPDALCGQLRCQKSYCRFCFPTRTMNIRAQYYPTSVFEFSPTHRHQFINGYETILNCPVTCQTKNILYALTCPCGQFDYIGCTSMSLGDRLAYHRVHGNRIIHEFILGAENIRRVQNKPKSQETLVKDGMLLYKHSARCPYAIQMFLDCNPHYWPLIPMPIQEAQEENRLFFHLPNSIPQDPTSHTITSSRTRSDHDTGYCMIDLPPFPSDQYTFSTRQCAEQFHFFKNKQDLRLPNYNLDLYNATIIAVLPDHCSTTLTHLVEALFITHAQTKLNTLGHLDGNIPSNNNNNHNNHDHWCKNLIRRPISSFTDE